jgi:predicted nucleic acid-binding protein
LSELRRPKPERRVVEFVSAQPLGSLYVSTVTLAEIRFAIAQVEDEKHSRDLQRWLEQQLRPLFADRVPPVSEDVIFRWRLLVEEGRKVQHTYSQPDLFIAATAQCHGLIIVTRGTKETRARARVFNPGRG